MTQLFLALTLFHMLVFANFQQPTPPAPTQAVVRAVLFYSPTCGHCHLVITETLPPLFEKYGDRLQIIGVDVSTPEGLELFKVALAHFKIERGGVPFLVVGDIVLIGSGDIPARFPGLIEQFLAQGGLDWPAIPGLAQSIQASQTQQASQSTPADSPTASVGDSTQTPEPEATPVVEVDSSPGPTGLATQTSANTGVWGRISRDPLGNSLAIMTLLGMVFSLAGAALSWRDQPVKRPQRVHLALIPIVCLLGLGVAAYLTYVETTQVAAVCGPVGDCNTVQQSEYAYLFGVIPVGLLGIVGFSLILLAWFVGFSSNRRLAAYSSLAMLAMATFGTLFSIYLTFLEPFVIGATCAWCLTSAILMTILLWLSLAPGKQAYLVLFSSNPADHEGLPEAT